MSTAEQADSEPATPMVARDVMTTQVVCVPPDASTRDIARLLLEHRISAVPVVDSGGVPVGMVSEGDLIGREEGERIARRDWWLDLLTGAQPIDESFRTRLQAADRTARDVMVAPLVTVAEDAELDEVARLLTLHHVKRVPVLRDGRIVGIVSRADLVRVVAAGLPHAAGPEKARHRNFLRNLFSSYHRPAWEVAPGPGASEAAPAPDSTRVAATDFRHLVQDHQSGEAQHRDEVRRAAAAERRRRAAELIDAHLLDEGWRQMLHRAKAAAESGETEYMLLRFPDQLCIDGGRAINVAEPEWPSTLRGEPAEIYLRWERELKPQGFTLAARVLEFPGGKPGDIGLFLAWAGA